VARFGDDRTALAKRQANKLLEPIRWWHSTDLMATVGRIKGEYDQTHYDTRPWAIFVDVIGLGAGVYDRCKELGLPVRAVNVGEAASTRENCVSAMSCGSKAESGSRTGRAQCRRTRL
jgi:phage terminase large subunit